LTKYFNTL